MSSMEAAALPPSSSKPAGAKARRRWGPADVVIAIATLLIVIVFAIFALLCVQGYAITIEGAKAKAQSAADVVAYETKWMVGASLGALSHVAGDLNGGGAPEKAGLDAMLKSLPAEAHFAMFDATGEAAPGGGSPSLPANIGDQDLFKQLAGGTDWLVSPQLADTATGKPIFLVAKRLGTTSFAGVAAIVLSGDAVADFWSGQKLGPESTVSIARADGLLVARYPALPQTIDLSAQPPFQDPGEAGGTYVSARSPADGVARVVAFQRIPEIGLVAFASVSQDAVLAGLWTSIITVLWLMGPIALALLAGSLVTARILRRSERTQASLAAAVAHNEVLFREIHHRVKNNLQSVGSLLQMQPIDKAIKANMGQRIAAMSAVHEHIYRSNNFSTVMVKGYLETLIESIRAGADPKVRVIEELDDLAVDKDAATPLGLIVNEVVANAFKHAFTDGRNGVITVRLVRDGTRGRLMVEDNGVGFDPETPVKGIGRRLIRALTEQLGGESTMESDGGSRFTLSFPLAR